MLLKSIVYWPKSFVFSHNAVKGTYFFNMIDNNSFGVKHINFIQKLCDMLITEKARHQFEARERAKLNKTGSSMDEMNE